jgi:hypothetical protein
MPIDTMIGVRRARFFQTSAATAAAKQRSGVLATEPAATAAETALTDWRYYRVRTKT